MRPVLRVRRVPLAHRERRDLRGPLVLPALPARLVRWVRRVLKGQPGRLGHKAPLARRVTRVPQVQVLSGEAHGTVPQTTQLTMS